MKQALITAKLQLNKAFVITIVLIGFYFPGRTQSIIGLWGVNEVLVGSRVVTPVAKWFRINEDGTCEAGNGWSQNNLATWTYDPKMKIFLTKNIRQALDPFGGFTVSLSDNNMIWKRIEEGDSVIVFLTKIEKLPMAPADSIKGRWTLKSTTLATNENIIKQIHIRPAGLFNLTTTNGDREFGFWHMDPHESRFFLINFDKTVKDKVYMVRFERDELIMTSVADNNVLHFSLNLDQ